MAIAVSDIFVVVVVVVVVVIIVDILVLPDSLALHLPRAVRKSLSSGARWRSAIG